MNTPTHMIMGAAVFARPGVPGVTLAALLGGFAPDLSLFAMAGWHLFILGTDPSVVFHELYFSDTWQQVFAIDNSFFLWGGIFAFGLVFKRQWLVAFSGSGLLHIAFDFLLHHDDARMHFWPLSDWIFRSPISYWDPDYYGAIVAPLEMLLSLILLFILWRRFEAAMPRVVIGLAGFMQLTPVFAWVFIFVHPSVA